MITTTHAELDQAVSMLLSGAPGSGKTYSLRTAPAPVFLINTERGHASLLDAPAMPMWLIKRWADLEGAYTWLVNTDEGRGVATIAIDSASDLADLGLAEQKVANKNGLAAYGALHDEFLGFLRAVRALDRHLVVIARQAREQSDEGLISMPSFPSTTLRTTVPHMFDLSLVMRVIRGPDRQVQRWIQCIADPAYAAKDRFGALEQFEPPDIGALISKIRQHVATLTAFPQAEATHQE